MSDSRQQLITVVPAYALEPGMRMRDSGLILFVKRTGEGRVQARIRKRNGSYFMRRFSLQGVVSVIPSLVITEEMELFDDGL